MEYPSQDLVLVLLVLMTLLVKHFLADYPLQNKYMQRKSAKKDWLLPLVAHSATHGGLTALLLLPLLGPCAFAFGLVDIVLHFCVDIWKARFTCSNPFQKRFWIALGLDQLGHNLTYVAMAFLALVCVNN